MGKYDDIIDLRHPEPRNRQRMPMNKRAAQFSPFAALAGYEEIIQDAERVTEAKKELSEDKLDELNRKFLTLKSYSQDNFRLTVTHFIPDTKKSGGQYISDTDVFVKADERGIILQNIGIIPYSEIIDISWETDTY